MIINSKAGVQHAPVAVAEGSHSRWGVGSSHLVLVGSHPGDSLQVSGGAALVGTS
jgi:hypothetical protein